MRHFFFKTLAGFVLAGLPLVATAADALGELNGLVMHNIKLPIYRKKDLLLQSVLFCITAEEQGRFLAGRDVVIDLVKEGTDADRISDAWRLPVYDRVKATPAEITKFWKKRPFSDGVVSTPQATLDKIGNTASGKAPVHFRSPDQDLDGVGFELDFRKRILFIKSMVKIRVRGGAKAPEMHAECDRMTTDLRKHHSELEGNVKVIREGVTTTCQKMAMDIDKEAGRDTFEGRKMSINKIICTGNVVVELGAAGSRQVITGDKAVYEIRKNKIVKATIDGNPKMTVFQNGKPVQESTGYEKIVMDLAGYDPASGKLPKTETIGGQVVDEF